MMTDIIDLLATSETISGAGTPKTSVSAIRTRFCTIKSVGMKEKYKALAIDHNPEIVAVLNDKLDYQGENYARYNGQVYTILRTYAAGIQMELTLEKTRDLDGVITNASA